MKKLIGLFFLYINCSLWAAAQQVTGLLGAFPPELALLQNKMENKKDLWIQNIHFIKGVLNGKVVVLAQTGIGKVNAAITTTLMIEHFKPHEIIFSGIAGGIDTTMAAGDIVIGTRVAYHDYGTLTDTGMLYSATKNVNMQLNPLYFTCDTNLVNEAVAAAGKLRLEKIKREGGSFIPVIKKGTIVTGDTFVASDAVTQRLRNDMHAAATEMEGASIAQTCWQQNVPFLIIRSLSDKANNKAANDVISFYQIAAQNSATLVLALVKELEGIFPANNIKR
jgi:adenosylhomocysteine nucleosidase